MMINSTLAEQRASAGRVGLKTRAGVRKMREERGIVLCAGGATYFTQAWVLIRALRDLGCTLPIELWHKGPAEIDQQMQTLVEPFDVTLVDALEVCRKQGIARLTGWAIKPLAISRSRFRNVLYLDADNVPARDPSDLFDDPEFQRTGALFWSDRYRGSGGPHRSIDDDAWCQFAVPFRDEPEFESGQMLVDRDVVWRELQLALHYNMNSDTYYRYVYGDKDTFYFAWRRLGREFAIVPFGPSSPPHYGVLFQLDLQGRIVFQHRARAKWRLYGKNRRVPGFQHEAKCFEYIDELRSLWDGRVRSIRGDSTEAARMARRYQELTSDPSRPATFRCLIDGNDRGRSVLHADASIEGRLPWIPPNWSLEEQPDGGVLLALSGDRLPPIFLKQLAPDHWSGHRLAEARQRVELILTPFETSGSKTPSVNGSSQANGQHTALTTYPNGGTQSAKAQNSSGHQSSQASLETASEWLNYPPLAAEGSAASYPPASGMELSSRVAYPEDAAASRSVTPSPYLEDEARLENDSNSVQSERSNEATVSVQSVSRSTRQIGFATPVKLRRFATAEPAVTVAAPDRSRKPAQIKIHGLPRTCSNLVTILLRKNFATEVYTNDFGWKHGPNILCEGDMLGDTPFQFVVTSRHPYAWLVSCYRYDRDANQSMATFEEFLHGRCEIYDGQRPIDCFNVLNRMWLAAATYSSMLQVVRSEDVQNDQHRTLARLGRRLRLEATSEVFQSELRRVDPDEAVRSESFDSSWHANARFLEAYDNDLLEQINEELDDELLARLGYQKALRSGSRFSNRLVAPIDALTIRPE